MACAPTLVSSTLPPVFVRSPDISKVDTVDTALFKNVTSSNVKAVDVDDLCSIAFATCLTASTLTPPASFESTVIAVVDESAALVNVIDSTETASFVLVIVIASSQVRALEVNLMLSMLTAPFVDVIDKSALADPAPVCVMACAPTDVSSTFPPVLVRCPSMSIVVMVLIARFRKVTSSNVRASSFCPFKS